MTTLLKLSLIAMVMVFMVTSVSAPRVSADPCVPGSYDYNPYTCAQINPSLCVQNPAYCYNNNYSSYSVYCLSTSPQYNPTLCAQYGGQYNQSSIYCQAGANYNAQLCAQYSGQASIYCQAGANYNAQLCAQYGGQYNQSSIYCQAGANYNAQLCAQYGGQYNQASIYCQAGANYNAQLCAQYSGQYNQSSIYCQAGASYNAQLCAQYGGTTNNAYYQQYCIPNTATYNAQLCAQYGGQAVSTTPTVISVQSASNTVNCGGSMSLLILVGAGNSPAVNAAVSLSATAGQVMPSSGTATNGTMTALFTAPTTAGSATITAVAGGITGTQQITVSCNTTTPSTTSPSTTTTSPSVAPPPSQPVYTSPPPPPPGGSNIFTPPNTGDGGLLALLQTED